MNSKTGTAGPGQEVCFSQSLCDTRDTATGTVRKLNQTRVPISNYKDFQVQDRLNLKDFQGFEKGAFKIEELRSTLKICINPIYKIIYNKKTETCSSISVIFHQTSTLVPSVHFRQRNKNKEKNVQGCM